MLFSRSIVELEARLGVFLPERRNTIKLYALSNYPFNCLFLRVNSSSPLALFSPLPPRAILCLETSLVRLYSLRLTLTALYNILPYYRTILPSFLPITEMTTFFSCTNFISLDNVRSSNRVSIFLFYFAQPKFSYIFNI